MKLTEHEGQVLNQLKNCGWEWARPRDLPGDPQVVAAILRKLEGFGMVVKRERKHSGTIGRVYEYKFLSHVGVGMDGDKS